MGTIVTALFLTASVSILIHKKQRGVNEGSKNFTPFELRSVKLALSHWDRIKIASNKSFILTLEHEKLWLRQKSFSPKPWLNREFCSVVNLPPAIAWLDLESIVRYFKEEYRYALKSRLFPALGTSHWPCLSRRTQADWKFPTFVIKDPFLGLAVTKSIKWGLSVPPVQLICASNCGAYEARALQEWGEASTEFPRERCSKIISVKQRPKIMNGQVAF